MATGGSNAAIGATLFISARSVEKHIGSIFTKLDLPETDDVNRRVPGRCLGVLHRTAGITMTDVRVLIVDDQTPSSANASKMVVEMTDGFEVVGEAENGEQAVEMAAALRPDLVLMDVQMPGIDGLEATRRIVASDDQTHVLVMSTHESGSFDQPALDAGALRSSRSRRSAWTFSRRSGPTSSGADRSISASIRRRRTARSAPSR